MTDAKIRIKPPHAGASLAQRAVVVSLCLLVAPLLLHSIFLYRTDYKNTLSDVTSDLTDIAKGQKATLEARLAVQWQILDVAASRKDPDLLQALGIVEMPMPSGLPNRFAVIGLGGKAIFTGRRVSLQNAIALSTPIEELLKQLKTIERSDYPLSLEFVSGEGKGKQEGVLVVVLPIEGSNFSLYISIPIAEVVRLNREWYVKNFLTLLFFVGVIGGLLVWLITRRISKPLQQLCGVMERVGKGAVHVRYTPDKMGFEINELGKQFNMTLDQLFDAMEEAERQKIGRERLAEEFKIGHDIQAGLFPSHPPEVKGLDLAAGFLPALEVGGDFYDLFPMENGKLLIVMADIAGKGISACLYSLGIRSMFRALATGKKTLSQIVLRANDLFWRDARHSGMFATVWIGIYDPNTNVLEYSTQGHPPAYLIRDGKILELWTPGIAIGAGSFDMVSSKQEQLQMGDLLFLYTDGVIESHAVKDQLFGKHRLQKFLLHLSPQSSQKIVENLLEEIEQFSHGQPQHDDITLLAMQVLDVEKKI
jgi:serine phosphatase RsbU (regulator of sigma subunit)